MAFFKQLRLLLKHKILLRRRQPATLILELFWPALVFLAILVARWQFPPTFRQTCYYNAKALPSAGMVNLLQSYVCNLDNPCLNSSDYKEVPNYPNASIHQIVDQILPLLTNKNVTSVINDLPKGIRLIASIIDTLSIPSVQNLLEDGFPLRKALRPSGWKKVQQELTRLESNLVPFFDFDLVTSSESIENPVPFPKIGSYDILVNSSINLIQFGIQSDNSGFQSIRSFRDVICDHTQLEKFLIVSPKNHIRLLSRHLCLLERKDLYYLFDLAQENIDFGQILEQLSAIFRSVGLNEHQQHVDNIITMIDTIDKANIFQSMSTLRNTSWMYDVPNLFNVVRSGDIDMMTLLKIVNDIEPMIYNDESDMNEQNRRINEARQQMHLDAIMQFYNLDDSTLKSVADLSFATSSNSDEESSTEIDDLLVNNDDDKDNLSLQNLSELPDLDTSESQVSQFYVPTSYSDPNLPNDSLSRKFLPKILANMDRLIDDTETFTKTPQWDSLLSAFQGIQMVIEMAEDASHESLNTTRFSSEKIENFILSLPKKIQTLRSFFDWLIPDKFQPLVYPIFNLFQRVSDAMLQHLSGAFGRALAEDKIYYFDKFAQLLISSLHNGTLPRKCINLQQAMCDFEQFQNVFVNIVDEETGEITVMFDEDISTLQGIQELGCLFFGNNYSENVEDSTPILAKIYYTLSTLNDTNQLSSSITSALSAVSSNSTNNSDDTFWTDFTSRMVEVYLLATKSVNANTWDFIFREISRIWKSNGLFDRIIMTSRIVQLSTNCFIPNRIVQSPIWRIIYRKNVIANEIFNVVLDEINESAESEALKVKQLSMGSTSLYNFLQQNLDVLPNLIDATFETILFNLPQFTEKMFQNYPSFISGWPCNRPSLVDLLSFTETSYFQRIHGIEEFLCNQMRMVEGDPGRIVDELIAPSNNESRIAPLIRAIQSKSTKFEKIHENLPQFDWVEAAMSFSFIKDSVEKIFSMENSMSWFPEIDNLDESVRDAFGRGQSSFLRFYTQGAGGLFTYLGDVITPFAIRYMNLNETFSSTCDIGVSGVLMAPVYNEKEWQCLFVSLNYASYTVKKLLSVLNEVLHNILNATGQLDLKEDHLPSCSLIQSLNNSSPLMMLIDSVPEALELFLNDVLLGDIGKTMRSPSLHTLLCTSNLNIDIFGSRRAQYQEIRKAICELSSELSSCSQLTMPEVWISTFEHLNTTWYQESPETLSAKSSFGDAYHSVYKFLTLFGQFNPKAVNHFMSKFETTNGQSYIRDILKRMNRLEYFRNKRFIYVLQSISNEVYSAMFVNDRSVQVPRHSKDRRDLIMALIYAFNELPSRLRQRYKLGGIRVKTPPVSSNDEDILYTDLLDSLLDWIDSNLLVASETFLQTITLDSQRLEKLFYNKYDTVSVWRSLCRSPVSQHFVVDNHISVSANKAKEEICLLDFNSVYDQWYRHAHPFLVNYTNQELVSVLMVKIGSFVDTVLNDNIYKKDLLKMHEWKPILSKLNRLVNGAVNNESNNMWIIDSISNFVQKIYSPHSIELTQNLLDTLQCGIKTIPAEGFNWELVPTVYRNKTQVMAFYSTLNSGFTLGSIGLNTFLSQPKFYNHLQMLAKVGKFGFCALNTDKEFNEVFAIVPSSSSGTAISVLRNLQTLFCESKQKFFYHLNPVSNCFDMSLNKGNRVKTSLTSDLRSIYTQFETFFINQKHRNDVEFDDQISAVVPPILDMKQWNQFFKWWAQEVEPYPNSGRTLLAMRLFQLVDVFADNHVIWKAFYRLMFVSSEMFAYSLRALQLSEAQYPMKPDLKFVSNKFPFNVEHSSKKGLSSVLTSAVSNLIFPEVNHFITFATFRQLRWIRHISHFFAKHPNILHDELCPTLNRLNTERNLVNSSDSAPVIVDDDFNDLLLLLCHNHPKDWIYTLTFKSNLFNIKTSPRPKFMSHRRIRERIGKLTQVLARMLDYNSNKNDQQLDHVIRFLKLKQLESIENVVGTGTILLDTIVTSQNVSKNGLNQSSIRQLIKTGWRSVPTLLDAIDHYICSYKKPGQQETKQTIDEADYSSQFAYRPKAPNMKVVMCEMPRWDFDRAYTYLSLHLDLKNMLQVFASSNQNGCASRCVTPLRFLSRWVDVSQDIFEQMSTSSFWSELKSCRRRQLLSLLASTKSSNTFLLRNSLRYVRFMNKFLSTVDKFSRDNNGISWNNVRQLWRTFSYFILNQVPAYVPITDIVRHDVNLPEYLNATLDRISTLSRSRAKQAIRLLTDSLLDINAISWHNFSNIALKEMICKQQDNFKLLNAKNYYLPIILKLYQSANNSNSSSISQTSLYETLCQSGHFMPIIDSLIAALDQKAINSRLSEIQKMELTRSEWVSDVFVPEMSELSSQIVSSGMLTDIKNKISLLQSTNQAKSESPSQKGINHLLISFVSLTRAKNFNTLYDTIKHAIDKLMPRFSEGPIVDSLSRILEGLRSLKDLSNRGLFQIKYPISDLLVNVENVKIFLQLNLGLDKIAINRILNATIDLSEFIEKSASVSFDSSAFCNQSLLYGDLKLQLLNSAHSIPNQETVVKALCTLSVTEDFKFNNQILNQLVIRKLTNNIVSLIMSGLLKKANIESTQINKALNAVKASSNAMPHVRSFIRNITKTLEFIPNESIEKLNLNSIQGGLQNLSLSHTSDLIGKIVCGSTTPALNREIKLLKFKVQQPKVNHHELNSFNSDFCLNGYKKIMEMQGGPVIWNFLKPILVGKILYTPKAPVTDAIMGHMNTTLRFMPRMVEMLHAWSQTLSSLETFYYQSDVNNRMIHIKHLIESVFVNGEANGLFDDIDTFNVIEKITRSGNVLAILKLIGQIAQCTSFDRFVGLSNEIELEEYARTLTKSHEFIAGIVFEGTKDNYSSIETVPTNIQYKIRIDIDFVPSTKTLKARIWEPGPRDNYLNDMGYLHGFVQIQELVDRSLMSFLTNKSSIPIQPEVHLQQQPYLCYGIDKFGNYIRSLAPLITTMAWIFLIAHLIRENVLERELHLEEVMRVMGLKSGVAWLTWFIIGITVMAFATLCGIFLLHIGQLIPASDLVLLFIFFMMFNVSLLMFCYMMSSFFKTATIAALSGIVAYLASFLPFMVAITLENEMSFIQKAFTCLSMSTSFCFGMMYMTRFEVQGVGMQWNNLWHSPMQGDTMSVGAAMVMMGIDSCIYFLVAWYISHVCPAGNNARRYPWFFFLSYSYWKYDFLRSFGFGEEEPIKLNDQDSLYTEEQNEDATSVVIENDGTFNILDPEDWKSLNEKNFDFSNDDNLITDENGTLKTIADTLKRVIKKNTATLTRKPCNDSTSTLSQSVLGMELRGLYVIYNERSNKSKHVAVSNLNLNLKEGQITTILGRNGAGKTTTINVLTGQMKPTSGTVTIYGYQIPEDFGRARRLLGYCPQYNTLFNNLTVREHLMFFSELKGLFQDQEAITKDVEDILHNMGLASMQHQMARHLSGGLKRRLCVALAFVGGSKLIILDEPTASVDPVARRRIWDLIVQQKRSRTVLLTTHHMDEAEILSDEVAVIHRGKLLCIGSPLLLKSKYGCGYQLTVSRQGVANDVNDGDELLDDNLSVRFGCEDEECNGNSLDTIVEQHRSDVERLIAFTKCLIPNASFVEDNNDQVILSLPHYDDHGIQHDYATFFRCFDSNIRTLGFGSYGVTSTTLEEVFLTLCNLEESNMPVDEARLAVARRLNYSNGQKSITQKKIIQMNTTTNEFSQEIELDSGFKLKSRQLYALLSKRFFHMIRDWKLLFCTLFLPCIFIAFAMAMTLIKPSFAPDPSLPLVPQIYGKSTVSFVSNLPIYDYSRQKLILSQNFINDLKLIENDLISTRHQSKRIDCLKPRESWRTSKCPILHEHKFESPLPQHLITLKGKAWDRHSRTSCKCDECFTDIAAMAHLIPTPQNTDYGLVYNLSKGVDVNQFLLRTQPEFMDRRWGGWSFHINDLFKEDSYDYKLNKNSPIESRKPIVKIWYDNNGFHSMPSYLSALNNAILRANLKAAGVANASQYTITTYSHPLHIRSNQLGDQSVMQQAGDAGIAIIILVGFIFIPTSFVFYIVRERMYEEKHLQRTFGVGPCLYWMSSLFWDVTVLVLAIGLASAIIGFFRLPIYMARLNLPAILTLLFFFGWAMINLIYLMEKLFTEPSLAFMGIYCLALFVGIHTMVMRLMIDVFKLIEITPTIYQIFEKVAVFLPPYLLLSGIVDVHRNQLFADIFTLFDQDTYVNPFKMEMLGKHFTIFGIEGCVFFLLNLAIECGWVEKLFSLVFSLYRTSGSSGGLAIQYHQEYDKDEDNDVAKERRRVNVAYGVHDSISRSNSSSPVSSVQNNHLYYSDLSSNSSNSLNTTNSATSDILRVFSVTKVFESMFGYKRAVNNITFSVPRGECFGLLGVNGAGKTTLFRILTGQVKATSGEASFNGQNIRKALASKNNNQSIGYCPQADALDNFLTPVEHLTIYAHLRGIPRHHIDYFVKDSIDKFQLQPHATMPVQALSRGNRRKLCLAIAMLGNPKLILLDEPTSGLDPQSRRYVCQCIQDAIRDQRSILLTSHSMEECDILCSRLAIMVNGRFKCIGSPQYLKHKFGTGYIITLRLSETKANFKETIEFIKENFSQAILRAHHHTMLEFNLPTNDVPLSTIFNVLQRAKNDLTLQDYSVSQTTLDQVFVSFASQQVNDYESGASDKSSLSNGNNNNNNITAKGNNQSATKFVTSFSVHQTKNNIKRHASMLMSLCRESTSDTSKSRTKQQLKLSQKQHSVTAKQISKGSEQLHCKTTIDGHQGQIRPRQKAQMKNNLLFSSLFSNSTKVVKHKKAKPHSTIGKKRMDIHRTNNGQRLKYGKDWSLVDYLGCQPSEVGIQSAKYQYQARAFTLNNKQQQMVQVKACQSGSGLKSKLHSVHSVGATSKHMKAPTASYHHSHHLRQHHHQPPQHLHNHNHHSYQDAPPSVASKTAPNSAKSSTMPTTNNTTITAAGSGMYTFMKVSTPGGLVNMVDQPAAGTTYDFNVLTSTNARHYPVGSSKHKSSSISSHSHQHQPHHHVVHSTNKTCKSSIHSSTAHQTHQHHSHLHHHHPNQQYHHFDHSSSQVKQPNSAALRRFPKQ